MLYGPPPGLPEITMPVKSTNPSTLPTLNSQYGSEVQPSDN